MMSALATVVMLMAYFPYLTYALPAIAGLFIMVIVIEVDYKWAFLTYLSASFLTFLFAEPESKLMFICLFGFYPILKSVIEKLNKALIEWVLKLSVYSVSVLLVYTVFAKLTDISFEDIGNLGNYGAVILFVFGMIVFVLYDIALSKMADFYLARFHSRFKRLFK